MRNAYSSSQRHKRHIPSKVCKAGASSGGADLMGSPPRFTKVLTSQNQIYAYGRPCSLILPKRFCDEQKVARHVTMTDLTGHTLWHMLCNNKNGGADGQLYYEISNGWREFAFDHSLKLNDKLLFTLVFPSHFVVEFATRRMRPTHDAKKYPWKVQSSSMSRLNHSKKDFQGAIVASWRSGSADKSNSSCFTIALMSKYHIHTTDSRRRCSLGLPKLFCDEHNVSNHVTMMDSTGHSLWHMRISEYWRIRGYYRINNGWREFAYDHSLKLNDKLVFTLVSPSHFLVEFATSKGLKCLLRPTRDGKDYPWPRYTLAWRNYSEKVKGVCKLQTPMRRQSCTLEIENRKSNAKESAKKPGSKELTHMECKNPDGTTYLQILDSESEFEEGSP